MTLTPTQAMAGRIADPDDPDAVSHADLTSALDEYVSQAASVHRSAGELDLTTIPVDLALHTAGLAMHSPADCAWRALGQLSVDTSRVSAGARWRAAAVIASGLRTLFNRWEASVIESPRVCRMLG
ncbi:hypothetical protein O0V02_04675 [Gordonia amicalis]|uniref:hypothetical protein n=1 Tax=Gordonia amicalis TaxID=89053 RepID=UPI0022A6E1F1|nr:hypothetical protein [Gordonia amicalis]MCZ0911731.1 hypothetical protein [Gordonia amicalis]